MAEAVLVASRLSVIRAMTRKELGRSALGAIAEIERLIGKAIAGAAITVPLPTDEDMERLFDLSSLDFKRLAELSQAGQRRPQLKSCVSNRRSGRGRSHAATRRASTFSNG